ncbi:MAG: arginase [Calditrichaeota bacterium]|nr:MAG: arginase [Calditrichota bacterium]
MNDNNIALISAYMDLGAGRRGVDMGPSAIRIAGLTERLEKLNYAVHEMGAIYAHEREICEQGASNLKYLDEISEVCKQIKDQVLAALEKGWLPLVLGGDHSIAMGSISGVASFFRQRKERIGLIWVDAHTDMNTPETSPSGNIHGMPLAVLLGYGAPKLTVLNGESPSLAPQNVTLIAARDIDTEEKELVRESGIRVFTMSEIDERGIGYCMDEAIKRATAGTCGFHLSFDMDAIDPHEAPGVGTPVNGGLTYREAHLICEKTAMSRQLLSMDVVEVNPILDRQNRTAELALQLIESALGKMIL